MVTPQVTKLQGRGPLTFSIIVAVHNEEGQIAAKLNDCLALRYPGEAIEIIVASDGSSDATENIVAGYTKHDPRIRLLRAEGRRGKSGAQNLAAARSQGDILLFTDADTRISASLLEQVSADFSDPAVGLVAPVVHLRSLDGTVSASQGAYWRFELWLRQMESDLGILATASGSAFAMRRELFQPIPIQFGDDCIVPIGVRLQGFRVIQDRTARVSDEMPHSAKGELRARIRMTARNWSGILSLPACMNPMRFSGTAWGLFSHKLLRWLTPFFLVVAFVTNAVLANRPEWAVVLFFQALFYAAAAIGWWRSQHQPCHRIFGYPFAFCLANLGFLLGIVDALRGRTVVAYK